MLKSFQSKTIIKPNAKFERVKRLGNAYNQHQLDLDLDPFKTTLGSEINVGSGINVGVGRF